MFENIILETKENTNYEGDLWKIYADQEGIPNTPPDITPEEPLEDGEENVPEPDREPEPEKEPVPQEG
jgi:hypothetical protein